MQRVNVGLRNVYKSRILDREAATIADIERAVESVLERIFGGEQEARRE